MSHFEVEQVIVAHVNQEIGPTLGHIRWYLKRSIVTQQSQWKHTVFSGIVVVYTRHIRIGEYQRRSLQRIFVDSGHIAACVRKGVTLDIEYDDDEAWKRRQRNNLLVVFEIWRRITALRQEECKLYGRRLCGRLVSHHFHFFSNDR